MQINRGNFRLNPVLSVCFRKKTKKQQSLRNKYSPSHRGKGGGVGGIPWCHGSILFEGTPSWLERVVVPVSSGTPPSAGNVTGLGYRPPPNDQRSKTRVPPRNYEGSEPMDQGAPPGG